MTLDRDTFPQLDRLARADVVSILGSNACVVLTGPPRCGKTDLAAAIEREFGDGAVYLYATGDPRDLQAQLQAIANSAGRLVIVDEVQQIPVALTAIRNEIEASRRTGKNIGTFLLLGSNSRRVRSLVAEALPAMYALAPLSPINRLELNDVAGPTVSSFRPSDVLEEVSIARSNSAIEEEVHWNRGGFPESLFASGDVASLNWRGDYIRAVCDGFYGLDAPSAIRTLEFVASRQGAELAVDQYPHKEARPFLRHLEDVGILRSLPHWSNNRGKVTSKPPKIYIRDSGLLHCLLRTSSAPTSASADYGASWEGYCIENLIAAAPQWASVYFYRDDDQNELDLLIQLPNRDMWAIEIEGRSAKLTPGFWKACDAVGATQRIVVRHGSTDTLEGAIPSLGLQSAMRRLQSIPRSI